MEIIWHGTASIELTGVHGRVLFDPFIPLRGSETSVNITEYDGFTDIFVTHGHFDHIMTIPEIVSRNPDVIIHCTDTPFRTLLKKGVREQNLRPITPHNPVFVNGFRITAFLGKHAVLPLRSMRRLKHILHSPWRRNISAILRENFLCRENGETLLFQVEAEGKRVCIMGSLNLREDIRYPVGADLLILPYNGWDDNYKPAVNVIDRLRPKKVLLDHYDDTFPPVTMPVDLSQIIEKYSGRVQAMSLRKRELV